MVRKAADRAALHPDSFDWPPRLSLRWQLGRSAPHHLQGKRSAITP
jgi:hypothetical protein